ncbi:hypothetical protein WDZ16_03140 [Pseudokineococcus marinus]|uniref:Uncharacterized protein n=1 Tax=Pseudokineococcus marinus TaxID=351215 RepID=A0A849BPM1_9ACTN|nr:hypothetical protein [Pseudokineococcus marinus]NNH22504.1 hypothetical protein [Pseudokineococcus marinus]
MAGAARTTVVLEPATSSPAVGVDGALPDGALPLPDGAADETRSLLRRAADLDGRRVRLQVGGCDRVDPLVRRCPAEEARRPALHGRRLVRPDPPGLVGLVGLTDDRGPTGVEGAADRP